MKKTYLILREIYWSNHLSIQSKHKNMCNWEILMSKFCDWKMWVPPRVGLILEIVCHSAKFVSNWKGRKICGLNYVSLKGVGVKLGAVSTLFFVSDRSKTFLASLKWLFLKWFYIFTALLPKLFNLPPCLLVWVGVTFSDLGWEIGIKPRQKTTTFTELLTTWYHEKRIPNFLSYCFNEKTITNKTHCNLLEICEFV